MSSENAQRYHDETVLKYRTFKQLVTDVCTCDLKSQSNLVPREERDPGTRLVASRPLHYEGKIVGATRVQQKLHQKSHVWTELLHVFASNSDWFIALLASVVIGQRNYFGFVFTTLKKPLKHRSNCVATARIFLLFDLSSAVQNMFRIFTFVYSSFTGICWLDSSVGRALHRRRRGHGFESRSSINYFQALFSQLLKLGSNCEDLSSIWSFIRSSKYMFHIFTFMLVLLGFSLFFTDYLRCKM